MEIDSLQNSYAFNRPLVQLQQISEKLDRLPELLAGSVQRKWTEKAAAFSSANQHLGLLDYWKTLERGYALVKKGERFVTGSCDLEPADRMEVVFHDGSVAATISGKALP